MMFIRCKMLNIVILENITSVHSVSIPVQTLDLQEQVKPTECTMIVISAGYNL